MEVVMGTVVYVFFLFCEEKIVNMIFKNIQRSLMSLLQESLNAADEVFDL